MSSQLYRLVYVHNSLITITCLYLEKGFMSADKDKEEMDANLLAMLSTFDDKDPYSPRSTP